MTFLLLANLAKLLASSVEEQLRQDTKQAQLNILKQDLWKHCGDGWQNLNVDLIPRTISLGRY